MENLLTLPSGRKLDGFDIEVMHAMYCRRFIVWENTPFTLNCGVESHVYVMGRDDLTEHPDFCLMLGRVIYRKAFRVFCSHHNKKVILIGVPMAGNTLALAASISHECDHPWSGMIGARVMRPKKKSHGAHQYWVDGRPDYNSHVYATIDNVTTNGNTQVDVSARLDEDGYDAMKTPRIIVVDRQQGGVERLMQLGVPVEPIYTLDDIVDAFGALNFWKNSQVARVHEEITRLRELLVTT